MVSFNFNLVKEPVHILKEYLYMYYYGILENTFFSDINNRKYLFYKFMVSFNFNLVKEPVHILKEYLYMYYYGILESCVKK